MNESFRDSYATTVGDFSDFMFQLAPIDTAGTVWQDRGIDSCKKCPYKGVGAMT